MGRATKVLFGFILLILWIIHLVDTPPSICGLKSKNSSDSIENP